MPEQTSTPIVTSDERRVTAEQFIKDNGLITREENRSVRSAWLSKITLCHDPILNRMVIVAKLSEGNFEVFKAGCAMGTAETGDWLKTA